ncbi:hypothetical protein ACHAXM_001653 [Skeletonema potamos]
MNFNLHVEGTSIPIILTYEQCTSTTWGALCQDVVNKYLTSVNARLVFQALTKISPKKRFTHYLIRFGDGLATIFHINWSSTNIPSYERVPVKREHIGATMILKPRVSEALQNMAQPHLLVRPVGEKGYPTSVHVDLLMTTQPFPYDENRVSVVYLTEHNSLLGCVDTFSIVPADGVNNILPKDTSMPKAPSADAAIAATAEPSAANGKKRKAPSKTEPAPPTQTNSKGSKKKKKKEETSKSDNDDDEKKPAANGKGRAAAAAKKKSPPEESAAKLKSPPKKSGADMIPNAAEKEKTLSKKSEDSTKSLYRKQAKRSSKKDRAKSDKGESAKKPPAAGEGKSAKEKPSRETDADGAKASKKRKVPTGGELSDAPKPPSKKKAKTAKADGSTPSKVSFTADTKTIDATEKVKQLKKPKSSKKLAPCRVCDGCKAPPCRKCSSCTANPKERCKRRHCRSPKWVERAEYEATKAQKNQG